uniref:Uncharacterized protein n=1 Tax=Moniliophthora roreri TaxID=221103 RepID=A0A0W0G6T7_MONRR
MSHTFSSAIQHLYIITPLNNMLLVLVGGGGGKHVQESQNLV